MSAFFYLPSNAEKNRLFLDLNNQLAQNLNQNTLSVNLPQSSDMMAQATFNYAQSQFGDNVIWPATRLFSSYLIQLGNKAQIDERINDAEKYYEEALKLDARAADEAWLGLGQVAASQGDFNQALTAYNNAVEANGSDCELYVSIAETQVKLKAWEVAINAFQQVIDNQHECRYGDGYIWYRIGSIYQHRFFPPNIEKAWQAYDNAQNSADFRPSLWLDADVHWQRGLILIDKNEIDRAETELIQAVTLRPKQYLAWVSLIKVQRIQRNWTMAEQTAQIAIDLDPNRPQAYRALGDLYIETDRTEEARLAYQKVLSIRPNDESVRNILQELNK